VTAAAVPSAWSPLRHRTYRALYIAQFASNAGTWMQVVGAQWLMGDLSAGPLLVALVQTATALPIFMLVLPAGAIGDILDRRRVLLVSQTAMLAGSGALAALAAADALTPALLLGLVFVVGAGQAFTGPSWQALMPELVGRAEIAQAAALNGVSFNVGRAVGPALGGLLIAAIGPEATFTVNALSFVGTVAVLGFWRRPRQSRGIAAEHLMSAIALGGRFVRSAPSLRVVLVRAGLFMAFASALWALLPIVARDVLELGSEGYGLLLGSVGVGAISGAFLLPRLRAWLSPNRLVAGAAIAYAAASLVVGLVHVVALVVAALVVAGLAWIAVFSSLNASAQMLLPDWARARGLSYYQLTFQGGQALGAAAWGALAAATDVELTFTVVAAGLAGTVLAGRRWRLVAREIDLTPARHWPEPNLVLQPEPGAGPVLVVAEWHVAADDVPAFREAMRPVERARRRTGARTWSLFQDGADPTRFLEAFTVATWEEHLRQREERMTVRDRELEQAAIDLAIDRAPPRLRHLLAI
jgi:MFS family permease